MISYEVIKEIAASIGIIATDGHDILEQFARAIYAEAYEDGRNAQRESDAKMCRTSDRFRGDYFAEIIERNTGELE